MRPRFICALASVSSVAGLAGAGVLANALTLFSGYAAVKTGDEYSKIFMGGTAVVEMFDGDVQQDAVCTGGGELTISGGSVGWNVYSISGSGATAGGAVRLTGGAFGGGIGGGLPALAVGGLGSVTIEAESFYGDPDGDGVADTPLDAGLVIDDASDLFVTDVDGDRFIPLLRWVYPDGSEQRAYVALVNAVGTSWTGSITLDGDGADPADFDGDGTVGSGDLAVLLAAWGTAGADLTGDGVTDSSDLAVLLAAWG